AKRPDSAVQHGGEEAGRVAASRVAGIGVGADDALVVVYTHAVQVAARARRRHARVIAIIVPDAARPKRALRARWGQRAADDNRAGIGALDGIVRPGEQTDVQRRVDRAGPPLAVNVHLVPDFDSVCTLGRQAANVGSVTTLVAILHHGVAIPDD